MIVAVVASLAGGAGAVMRYLADRAVHHRFPGPIPWGTLLVNVTGSLLLGLLTGLVLRHGISTAAEAVLGVGFCGGLTTWSTASWESVRLFESGLFTEAFLYTLGGLAASVAAAALGLALGSLY